MLRMLHMPCMFKTITGFYCPGCGGRRAVDSLLTGHFLKSLYYNPMVIYTLGVVACLAVRYVRCRVQKTDTKGALLPDWVFYLGIAIALINCVLKNILLYYFHIEMPLLWT